MTVSRKLQLSPHDANQSRSEFEHKKSSLGILDQFRSCKKNTNPAINRKKKKKKKKESYRKFGLKRLIRELASALKRAPKMHRGARPRVSRKSWRENKTETKQNQIRATFPPGFKSKSHFFSRHTAAAPDPPLSVSTRLPVRARDEPVASQS